MRRGELAAAVAAAVGPDPLVVCSLGSASRAWRGARAPNLTYYASDPMGASGSLALGLALAVRPRRVLHLAGDGDLTMNLQVLLALAGAPPCGLAVLVVANHRYETGGGQPLAGAGPGATDLPGVAAAAGLRVVPAPVSLADVPATVGALWDGPGVGFAAADVEPEPSPYGGPGEWSGVEERALFLQRLRHPVDAIDVTHDVSDEETPT
jgi:thiamine pyrophosphate-dependent acetolactate synthase large subunit-like protein